MIRISSFNVYNDYKYYNTSKTLEIYNYLVNNRIDILGLQEVYSKIDNDLKILLKGKYSYNGRYRFNRNILLKRVNEMNPIITKYNIIYNKTFYLPHYPSLLNRVVSLNIIRYKNYNISIYNTYLDYKYDKVKLKQLKYIYNLISNDNNLIILMGDFNLKNNKSIFNRFCSLLEKRNIKRVEFNDRTLKASKYHREIDHIFLSKGFEIIDKKIIKNLSISDHYPIMVDVKI